ncbi:hypothetical protein ATANTOWER_004348 [Ataeniobius toweri]|uniref:Uncharacterized protein n=1 Tax=Ataeniobius toweri TaxID=208326 RepID=A0ABU7BWN8_9TELE|nr:hypothetical protein [Ataeniobius toweri]
MKRMLRVLHNVLHFMKNSSLHNDLQRFQRSPQNRATLLYQLVELFFKSLAVIMVRDGSVAGSGGFSALRFTCLLWPGVCCSCALLLTYLCVGLLAALEGRLVPVCLEPLQPSEAMSTCSLLLLVALCCMLSFVLITLTTVHLHGAN